MGSERLPNVDDMKEGSIQFELANVLAMFQEVDGDSKAKKEYYDALKAKSGHYAENSFE